MHYFVLIRLPNVFTVLTNILAGYFSLTGVSDADAVHVSMLMASSALLYVAGIVFNDYFDREIDRKERPFRPIPSGKVSRRGALYLAVAALVAANVLALLVSVTSLAISAALSAVIIAYDYKIKHGRLGPAAMGLARFLNVFLGASPALFLTAIFPWMTLFAAGVMFAYIYSISLLSRREVGEYENASYGKSIAQSFSIIAGVAASTVVFAFYMEVPEMLVNIVLFSIVMYIILKHATSSGVAPDQKMQKAVKSLVLSIVILDSAFITAFAGLYYGIASLAIIVPAIVLAKKLYVT
jgi:4-hydroxybenzoate polyprenyltransferase